MQTKLALTSKQRHVPVSPEITRKDQTSLKIFEICQTYIALQIQSITHLIQSMIFLDHFPLDYGEPVHQLRRHCDVDGKKNLGQVLCLCSGAVRVLNVTTSDEACSGHDTARLVDKSLKCMSR